MPDDLRHKHFAPYVAKKGEEYMSSKQLAHFRTILETLKAELMDDIERTVHTMQDEATVFADPNDRASQKPISRSSFATATRTQADQEN